MKFAKPVPGFPISEPVGMRLNNSARASLAEWCLMKNLNDRVPCASESLQSSALPLLLSDTTVSCSYRAEPDTGCLVSRIFLIEISTIAWLKKSCIQVINGLSICPVKSQIIEQCAMSLEFPPLVRSGIFLFFHASQRGWAALFLPRFPPLFRGREFLTTWHIVQLFEILRYQPWHHDAKHYYSSTRSLEKSSIRDFLILTRPNVVQILLRDAWRKP